MWRISLRNKAFLESGGRGKLVEENHPWKIRAKRTSVAVAIDRNTSLVPQKSKVNPRQNYYEGQAVESLPEVAIKVNVVSNIGKSEDFDGLREIEGELDDPLKPESTSVLLCMILKDGHFVALQEHNQNTHSGEGLRGELVREKSPWVNKKFLWFCKSVRVLVEGFEEDILRILMEIENRRCSANKSKVNKKGTMSCTRKDGELKKLFSTINYDGLAGREAEDGDLGRQVVVVLMKLRILSWNVRGLHDPNKMMVIKSMGWWELGLGDSRCKGMAGRVLLLWDKRVLERLDVEVGSFSISCRFRNCKEGFFWVSFGLYDPLKGRERKELWEELAIVKGLWNEACFIDEFELVDPSLGNGAYTWSGRGRRSFVLAKKLHALKCDLKKWTKELGGRGEVIQVFEELHSQNAVFRSLNATFLVLISKKGGASDVQDFKPISLVGSLYKIIAKVLANKLKGGVKLKNKLAKSEITPVGATEDVDKETALFGCKVGKLPTTYLGLPLGAPHKSCKVKIKFWKDCWCTDTPLSQCFNQLFVLAVHRDATIEEMWDHDAGQGDWKLVFVRDFNDWEMDMVGELLHTLRGQRPSLEDDSVVWRQGRNGIFKIKEAYRLLDKPNATVFPARKIWVDRVPTKVCFFAWEATWGKVLTLDRLQLQPINLLQWLTYGGGKGLEAAVERCTLEDLSKIGNWRR
ncbi:hypothetical protein CK203_089437 [Vitis vinifera]|uniref:Reverse transcriptase zinc-binding domain-containing protein n=1 Tax=Vitis vinifera TaxID=29760 RepID=A0A438E9D2_VITVI|nr:hypothetical protein CK203_089437 [Vitis vinifera]